MAACYCAERDGRVSLPWGPQTMVIRYEVWDTWRALDPICMVDKRVDALRSLRAIWVDAGRRDDYCLDLGAQAFSSRLTAHGIEHHCELFGALHAGIEHRYPLALRFLAERLQGPARPSL